MQIINTNNQEIICYPTLTVELLGIKILSLMLVSYKLWTVVCRQRTIF